MILTLSPNPTLERVALVEHFQTGQAQKPMRIGTWAGGGGLREASVVQLLGGEILALGFVGGHLGDLLLEALERQHIPQALVPIASPTRGGFTTIDKERGFVSELPDAAPLFSDAETEKLLTVLDTSLAEAEMLILSDAGEGVGATLFPLVMARARAAQVPVYAYVAGAALDAVVAAGAWTVQMNIKTLQKQTERSLAHDSAILQEAQAMRSQGVTNVIVTLGEEGALLITDGGAYRIQAPVVSHYNPTGSGATLAGAFVVQYLRNRNVIDAVRYGCAAASVNVSHDEPGYATPGEVGVLYPHTQVSPVLVR